LSNDIFKNSIWYTILGFLPLSFSLLFTPIYLAYLNEEQYGLLSLFVLYTGLTTQVYNLGLSSAFGYLYWDVYKDKKKLRELISSILGILLFFQFVFLVIGLIFGESLINIIVKSSDQFTFYPFFVLVLILSPFMVYFEIFKYYYRNEGKLKQYATTAISTLILLTAGTLVGVVWLDLKAIGAVFGRSIGYILVIGLLLVSFIYKYGVSFNFSKSKPLLLFSLPLFVNTMIGALGYGIDKIMIERLDSLENYGIYAFALVVISVIEIWFNSINNALSPTLYKLINESINDKVREIKGLSNTIIMAVLIVLLLIIAFSIPAMELLINESFHKALPLIPILSAAFIWRVFANLTSYSIYIKKKTKYMLINQSSSLIITIVFGYLGYQILGMIGVAVGIYIVRVLEYVIMHYISQRIMKIPYDFKKFILIGLVVGITSFICSFQYETNQKSMLLFLTPLISALVLIPIIAKKEIQYITYTFKHRKELN